MNIESQVMEMEKNQKIDQNKKGKQSVTLNGTNPIKNIEITNGNLKKMKSNNHVTENIKVYEKEKKLIKEKKENSKLNIKQKIKNNNETGGSMNNSNNNDNKDKNKKIEKEKFSQKSHSSSILSTVSEEGTQLPNYDGFLVMSNQNQFTGGGVSSCTINATEAAFRLLGRPDRITKALIDEIIQIGSYYDSQTHNDFEILHQKMTRYNNSLQVISVEQKHIKDIHTIIDTLKNHSKQSKKPIAAICTKTPETITLYINMEENECVVFDSHSRKIHQGAAFIYFLTLQGMIKYLKQLLPIIQLDFDNNYQELILNSINITYIKLKNGFVGPFKANKEEKKQLLWEIRDFEQQNFKKQISDLKKKCYQFEELQKQNTEFEKEIQALNNNKQNLQNDNEKLRVKYSKKKKSIKDQNEKIKNDNKIISNILKKIKETENKKSLLEHKLEKTKLDQMKLKKKTMKIKSKELEKKKSHKNKKDVKKNKSEKKIKKRKKKNRNKQMKKREKRKRKKGRKKRGRERERERKKKRKKERKWERKRKRKKERKRERKRNRNRK
ncbi:chascon [Anaeramoeba flamelloides]|uniref:Chascon n=1 Tax=Anaeramoeba flamelloides TaxID=1746091 RepID=A0ABQ8X6Q6_9EUKA|nr:chascon [Anaeramoeba flamelloides]